MIGALRRVLPDETRPLPTGNGSPVLCNGVDQRERHHLPVHETERYWCATRAHNVPAKILTVFAALCAWNATPVSRCPFVKRRHRARRHRPSGPHGALAGKQALRGYLRTAPPMLEQTVRDTLADQLTMLSTAP